MLGRVCQQPPNCEKKGAFIHGNDAKAKNSIKSSLEVQMILCASVNYVGYLPGVVVTLTLARWMLIDLVIVCCSLFQLFCPDSPSLPRATTMQATSRVAKRLPCSCSRPIARCRAAVSFLLYGFAQVFAVSAPSTAKPAALYGGFGVLSRIELF